MNRKQKKLSKFYIFLSTLFIFQVIFLSSINTSANTQTKVNYIVNGTPSVGNTIEILVNISNVENLYGGSVDFIYDTSLLKIESIEKGDLFDSRAQVPVKKQESGQANIAITLTGNASTISGDGTLAVIKATILKEGTVNLKCTNNNSQLDLNGNTIRINC